MQAWGLALPHRIKDFGSVAWHAMGRFWRNNDLQASAALTYTTLLALVPLLTVTFAIFTAFPAYSRVREQAQTMLFEFLVPQVGQQVQGYASQFMANAAALTGFGAVGLTFSAILLFSSIEGAFNAIWRITEPRPLLMRVLSFWAVLTMAPLLLGASMSLSSSMAVDFHAFGGKPSRDSSCWSRACSRRRPSP
ncbi:YihY family inner membrane protein [Aerophototrophica crusticola]|uniref:YihY family inner membrane protein n=1 Tax=Aerophototrophica crusticola TaxID=1709002 RepID=UPI00384E12D5